MTLDLPDNVTAGPRGTLVLCEDGDGDNYLRGLTPDGSIFDFARMEPVAGNPGAEFAGSTFTTRTGPAAMVATGSAMQRWPVGMPASSPAAN